MMGLSRSKARNGRLITQFSVANVSLTRKLSSLSALPVASPLIVEELTAIVGIVGDTMPWELAEQYSNFHLIVRFKDLRID